MEVNQTLDTKLQKTDGLQVFQVSMNNIQVHNTKYDVSAEISWIKDLKISLKANRNYSENYAENYVVVNNEYNALSPNSFGNFEISTIILKTSFEKAISTILRLLKTFKTIGWL